MMCDLSLPYPSATANKYSRGKVILLAGSRVYPGAACLTGWASQYCGAGYTELFTSQDNLAIARAFRPSLVVRSFDCFDAHRESNTRHSVALVAGSGFDPQDHEALSAFHDAVAFFAGPLLVDGGALTWAAQNPTIFATRHARGYQTLLTPHGGEAQRLACAVGVQDTDQVALARELSARYHATVILKGPDTVIADATHTHTVTEGTAALAKAGTGDVLAGMIGALLAQGKAPFDAAVLGVVLHGRAGVEATKRYGIMSVCAEEVIQSLPAAIQNYKED